MLRTVSSSPLAPSVKVKLINAGFHTAADLTEVQPLQLCKGTLLCKVCFISAGFTAESNSLHLLMKNKKKILLLFLFYTQDI